MEDLATRRLVTLSVETVETVDARDRRATIRGVVWLGPVAVGDCFTAAARWDHADAVQLRLEAMTERTGAQEIGRTLRVTAVLAGDGVDLVRAGTVLVGEVDRAQATGDGR